MGISNHLSEQYLAYFYGSFSTHQAWVDHQGEARKDRRVVCNLGQFLRSSALRTLALAGLTAVAKHHA